MTKEEALNALAKEFQNTENEKILEKIEYIKSLEDVNSNEVTISEFQAYLDANNIKNIEDLIEYVKAVEVEKGQENKNIITAELEVTPYDLELRNLKSKLKLRENYLNNLQQKSLEIKNKIVALKVKNSNLPELPNTDKYLELEQKNVNLSELSDIKESLQQSNNLPEIQKLERELISINNDIELKAKEVELIKVDILVLENPELKIDLEKTELVFDKPLGEQVEINDPYLAELLDNTLKNNNNRDPRSRVNGYKKFTKEELATVKELTIFDSRIENINQLDYCVNLKNLEISSNSREKVASDLALGKKIEQMVNSSNIKDFSVIGRLKNLSSLNISFQRYLGELDISPLEHLKSLELYYNTNLVNLTGLTETKELAELVLAKNTRVQPFNLPSILIDGNLDKAVLDFDIYTRIKDSYPLMEEKVVEEKVENIEKVENKINKGDMPIEKSIELGKEGQYTDIDREWMVAIINNDSLSDSEKVANAFVYSIEGNMVDRDAVNKARARIFELLKEKLRQLEESEKEKEPEQGKKQEDLKQQSDEQNSIFPEREERLPDIFLNKSNKPGDQYNE